MDEMIQKILANITTAMEHTSLSEPFMEAVLKRLVSFGYELKEEDGWSICFASQKVENHIKNSCNTTSIPLGLVEVAIDMICGEFLFAAKHTGKLELESLDLDGAITQVHLGDASVQIAGGSTDESKFNELLNLLLHGREGEFVCYRKLKW